MNISENGIQFIKDFEGVRLKAYDDGIGVATIGVGHIKGVKMGDVATMEQVDQWLREDLQESEEAVDRYVAHPINQNQFDALVSFVFNLGAGAFKGSTLLKKLNAGAIDEAADEFLRWTRGGGKVMPGLVRRREAERKLFLS